MKNFVQVAKYFGHLFRRALLHYPKLFYTISTIIYLIIYMSFLNWITYDMLGYMRGYQAIVSHGISAFRETNFDYSPASMYWFSLSTLLPYPSYINIKLIALPFIPLSGFIISRIILMFTHNRVSAWLGYTFSIITPTIIINSALWGQMDVYYTRIPRHVITKNNLFRQDKRTINISPTQMAKMV